MSKSCTLSWQLVGCIAALHTTGCMLKTVISTLSCDKVEGARSALTDQVDRASHVQEQLLCCSDVCVEAKLDCGHERTLQLCHIMMAATKEDTVSLNDFLRVINNFTDSGL